jgi:hypothetical protein
VSYLYVSAFGTVQKVPGGATGDLQVSAAENPIEYIIQW